MPSSSQHLLIHPGPDAIAHDARRILDKVLSAMHVPEMSEPAGRAALMAAIANEAISRMANQSKALTAGARPDRPLAPSNRDCCDCGCESDIEPPLITAKAEIH